ncbi:MAG: phospholipase D family protein, partial [Planctomycetota bacterium]
ERRGSRVSIATELKHLAGRGVRIEILHGAVPSEPFLNEVRTGEPFPPGTFETKFCSRVHMKLVLVDYREIYFGSANFTGAGIGARHADSRNFEVGIFTHSEVLLDRAMELFDRVWSGTACRSCLRAKKCPEPLEGISF